MVQSWFGNVLVEHNKCTDISNIYCSNAIFYDFTLFNVSVIKTVLFSFVDSPLRLIVAMLQYQYGCGGNPGMNWSDSRQNLAPEAWLFFGTKQTTHTHQNERITFLSLSTKSMTRN